MAQYADSTIYSCRLKISQAVLYLKKLPDDFTQADVDDYLTMLLDRIVPGGGIDKRGVWHHLKGCKHNDFLFPVAAMSSKYRGRFMSLLTKRLKMDGFVIDQAIRKQCFAKDWVVHSKPPAKGVNQVLEYIGRYAFRVAISNSRIRLWNYCDYSDYFPIEEQTGMHKIAISL